VSSRLLGWSVREETGLGRGVGGGGGGWWVCGGHNSEKGRPWNDPDKKNAFCLKGATATFRGLGGRVDWPSAWGGRVARVSDRGGYM